MEKKLNPEYLQWQEEVNACIFTKWKKSRWKPKGNRKHVSPHLKNRWVRNVVAVMFFLAFPFSLFAQHPCFVEVTTDTVTAVKIYYDVWEQRGFFSISQKEKRDSIGIRIEEVTRLYYLLDGEKVYLPFVERKYLFGEKNDDRRFKAAGEK